MKKQQERIRNIFSARVLKNREEEPAGQKKQYNQGEEEKELVINNENVRTNVDE